MNAAKVLCHSLCNKSAQTIQSKRRCVHRPSRALCRRRITLSVPERRWEVVDEIDGEGKEALTWRLLLAPGAVQLQPEGNGRHRLLLSGSPPVEIALSLCPGLTLDLVHAAASDRYGVQYQRPCLLATGRVELPARIVATFTVSGRV